MRRSVQPSARKVAIDGVVYRTHSESRRSGIFAGIASLVPVGGGYHVDSRTLRRKAALPLGKYALPLAIVTRTARDSSRSTVPACVTRATIVQLLHSVWSFVLCRILMMAFLWCCGISPSLNISTMMRWSLKHVIESARKRNSGDSVSSRFYPTAFPRTIVRTASAAVGSAPSVAGVAPCLRSSTTVGSSMADPVLSTCRRP